jgi:hypothetical protein
MGTFAQDRNQPHKAASSALTSPNFATLAGDNHRHYVHDSRHYGVPAIDDQAARPALRADTAEPDAGPADSFRFSHDFSGIPVHANAPAVAEAPTVVRPASALADRAGANAVTVGRVVHLASHLPRLDWAEQRRVLAHEAIHVAQQSGHGPAAGTAELEAEADRLAAQALAGASVRARLHADATLALADDRVPTPKDRLDVERAKKRREVLLRYKNILEGNQAALEGERADLRTRRSHLDESMKETLDLLEQAYQLGVPGVGKPTTVASYRQEEQAKLAGLNARPITIEMTATAIRLHARFQVRFEGLTQQQAEAKFPTLKKNFEQGVRDTWNQKLRPDVLGGRTFELIPQLSLISAAAPRDMNSWLITVRPTDKGSMTYEGKSLGAAPGGIPTSVTDPLVDGGVMSIPPSHILLPETLGHETLHLFGMVDRYVIVPASLSTSHKPGTEPLRKTTRRDPLGSQGGKILEEDLGFALEASGAYRQAAANLSSLTEGMDLMAVFAELERVQEIIDAGRDPHSLIPERKDFREKILESAQDLD